MFSKMLLRNGLVPSHEIKIYEFINYRNFYLNIIDINLLKPAYS